MTKWCSGNGFYSQSIGSGIYGVRAFWQEWHHLTWQLRGRWFRGTGDMFLFCLFWHLFWSNIFIDSSENTFLSGLTLIFCFLSHSTSEQTQQDIHQPYWTPYTSTLNNTYTNTTTLFTMHTKPQQTLSSHTQRLQRPLATPHDVVSS